jgi:hypothetical protein
MFSSQTVFVFFIVSRTSGNQTVKGSSARKFALIFFSRQNARKSLFFHTKT